MRQDDGKDEKKKEPSPIQTQASVQPSVQAQATNCLSINTKDLSNNDDYKMQSQISGSPMKFDKVSGYTMNENDSPDRKETGKFCLD